MLYLELWYAYPFFLMLPRRCLHPPSQTLPPSQPHPQPTADHANSSAEHETRRAAAFCIKGKAQKQKQGEGVAGANAKEVKQQQQKQNLRAGAAAAEPTLLAKNQLVDLRKDADKAVWLLQHLLAVNRAKLGSLTLRSGNVAVGNFHIDDQQLANNLKPVVWCFWRPVSLSIGQLQGKGRPGASWQESPKAERPKWSI